MYKSPPPPLSLHIVWHPSNSTGADVADCLYRHFRQIGRQDVAGRAGLSVFYRNSNASGEAKPDPIDWERSDISAVVILVDKNLDSDPNWRKYVHELAQIAKMRRDRSGLFPVIMKTGRFQVQFDEQELRWDPERESETGWEHWLIRSLTHEFCRMLRHHLYLSDGPKESTSALDYYLQPVRVFISHSKHDDDGQTIANRIRDWLHRNSAMDSFFDIYDLPAGVPFEDVLLNRIETGAVMVVHTDSYSSREWCRREVTAAKKYHVPMVVLNCVRDRDPRSFAYMGNVPNIRMDPDQDRIAAAIGYLLDEVFRTYIWHCRVQRFKSEHPEVLFLAQPPELITLATLPVKINDNCPMIVHAEPGLDLDAVSLFSRIAPETRIRTLAQWLEEVV